MVICRKKQKHCLPQEVETGDCWIALSLAQFSGLILTGRVGKHTDELTQELVTSTEGKSDCKQWHTDGWGGYERVLNNEVDHYISKALTQRLERTNGIVRQQTGRWHRRQNKAREVVEPVKSHLTFGHQLLQLDLAAFMFGNYGGTASRTSRSSLDLE